MSVFERAISLGDNSLSVQEEIADYCLEQGINEYAQGLLEFVHKQMPTRNDIVYKLGVTHENLGEYRKALDFFIEAGKKDRDSTELQVRIAKNYIASGQVLRAEQLLHSILRKEPENEPARELLKQCL